MKPADIKPRIYIHFNKENNKEGSKFKVGDNVRISKYKNSFAKGYVLNWFEEVFVIKKVKNTVPWTYVKIEILTEKKLLECFIKKNCKKQIKKSLELKE